MVVSSEHWVFRGQVESDHCPRATLGQRSRKGRGLLWPLPAPNGGPALSVGPIRQGDPGAG